MLEACIFHREDWDHKSKNKLKYKQRCFKDQKMTKCTVKKDWRECRHYIPQRQNFNINNSRTYYYKGCMNATYLLLDRLFAHERRRFSADKRGYSHRRRREKLGHYPFIPRDIDHAMCMIMAAKTYLEKTSNRRSGKFKFLDAGCGVGNIVMLAYAAGFDAYGVEYDPKTLEWGKSLFEQFLLEPERLMQGDILEFNNYADYDVIYAYCPMLKGELERRFEEKAAQEAKPGAVIIGFHPSNMYFKDKRPNVILKQYSLHIVENDSCYTTMLVKA